MTRIPSDRQGSAARPERVEASFPHEPETVWVATVWASRAVAPWLDQPAQRRVEAMMHELIAGTLRFGSGTISASVEGVGGSLRLSVSTTFDPEQGAGEGPGAWIVESAGAGTLTRHATRWGVVPLRGGRAFRAWAEVGR